MNFFDNLCNKPSRRQQKFNVGVTKLMPPDEIRRLDGTDCQARDKCWLLKWYCLAGRSRHWTPTVCQERGRCSQSAKERADAEILLPIGKRQVLKSNCLSGKKQVLKSYCLSGKKEVLKSSYCLSGKKEVLKWYRLLGRSEEILLFSIRMKHFLKWNYLSGRRQVLTTTRRRLPRATPSYRRPTRGDRQAASTGPDTGSPWPP